MRAEIARGAAWMLLFRLFDRAIGIVSTALLARLLIPADFGLVAMAMSVIAIIELATAFSFEVALIQKADPKREHYDTAWTLNILIAAGCAAVTTALAHAVASFYGDVRLVPVMFCIAAAWFVSGFENVGVANFRRNMDFAPEFRFLATKRVVTFVVTIIAAVTFHSYWALVIGMATGRVIGVVLSYLMQPFRPRPSLACARELFSFSGWLLANNMAGVILSRMPHFVVGRVFGAQTLGAYTVASEISQLAHTDLVAPINRAMFPGYSRLTHEPDTFRRVCIEATAAILLIVLPVSFAMALFAEPIVRILLGTQWTEAVPVVQILAFAGVVSAITSNNINAYLALGRPHLITLIVVTRLVLFAAMIGLFATGELVTTVAYAELVAALGSLLVSLPILFHTVKLSPWDYLASLWRPLVASGLGAVGAHFMLRLGSADGSFAAAVVQLLLGLPCGLLVYMTSLWLLWHASGRPASVEARIGRRVIDAVVVKLAQLRKPAV